MVDPLALLDRRDLPFLIDAEWAEKKLSNLALIPFSLTYIFDDISRRDAGAMPYLFLKIIVLTLLYCATLKVRKHTL
jgi:hypothetical protein